MSTYEERLAARHQLVDSSPPSPHYPHYVYAVSVFACTIVGTILFARKTSPRLAQFCASLILRLRWFKVIVGQFLLRLLAASRHNATWLCLLAVPTSLALTTFWYRRELSALTRWLLSQTHWLLSRSLVLLVLWMAADQLQKRNTHRMKTLKVRARTAWRRYTAAVLTMVRNARAHPLACALAALSLVVVAPWAASLLGTLWSIFIRSRALIWSYVLARFMLRGWSGLTWCADRIVTLMGKRVLAASHLIGDMLGSRAMAALLMLLLVAVFVAAIMKRRRLTFWLGALTGWWRRLLRAWKQRACQLLGLHADVVPPPAYWKNSDSEGFYREKVDVTTELGDAFQALMNATCDSRFIGQGRDGAGFTHKYLRVTKVERIENAQLWRKYGHERREIRPAVKDRLCTVSTHRQASNEWLHSLELEAARGEVLLFSGAPSGQSGNPDVISAVWREGFDERVASLGGMFGVGVYFAERCSKADAYAGGSSQTKAKMFLSRVVLGTPHLTSSTLNGLRRPPTISGKLDAPGRVSHERRCDSVIFDGTNKNYKEFIVYHRYQCYPEFLIEYDRVLQEPRRAKSPGVRRPAA